MTALAALVVSAMLDSVDVPAIRGGVLAWVVVWFVLGYALYATVFGALGRSRRGPRTPERHRAGDIVLLLGFLVSFAAIGSPDTGWAQLVSSSR